MPETILPAQAFQLLYQGALAVIGLLLLTCLIRAVRGPRLADRVIAINMMGTLTVISICVLAFLLEEGYLVDVALIYAMLSFLAVVLLTRLLMNAAHNKEKAQRGGEDE